MKGSLIKTGLYAVALMLLGACNSRMDRTLSEIRVQLDSLQLVHAPDQRITLWDLTLAGSSGSIRLSGELSDPAAFSAVESVIAQRFPEVQLSIRLLPEGGGTGLVNGLINNSVAHLRSAPSHRAEMVTQVLLGTPVRILKQENGWHLVQTPNLYLGWLDDAALQRLDEQAVKEFRKQDKIIYHKQYGFSYEAPDDKSVPVTDLAIGCMLPVVSNAPGFHQVRYPDGRLAWVKSEEVIPVDELTGKEPDAAGLVDASMQYMGIPYLWGGTSSKGMDCSGFTSMIYFMNGIQLPRDANQQSITGRVITTSYDHAELEPGDLLFFGQPASDSLPERVTHVAMYIGDTEFIHASGRVKVNSMDPSRENYLPEYPPIFVRSVRILGQEGSGGIQRIAENDFYREILTMAP